ncbi:hypothetical protein BpJC7_25080 [Weizmannia acidilactici]|uniref:histidine kinase n=2 Tax=Weizmannia acidilactici TaxID=2607726 RepID=A0A5J4JKI7_9BACI|nr:GAF domain-containing sensor histidine kinase [Weizmannia acidilactici]GER71205.1 hypothetical protein BpJC7_25080 [Weizmannia acidilactici]GER74848.1 hypothetical protein BpPP18_29150 [Weizmannia acidilactici]
MLNDKYEMIALLTGVKSSKKNYYTELKNTIEQVKKKNLQLEIMNEIMKSIKVDMPLGTILENMIEKLKKLIHFDHLSISLLQNHHLVLTNVFPLNPRFMKIGSIIRNENSLYWSALIKRKVMVQRLDDPSVQFYESKYLALLHLKNILVLPIYSKNKKIGVLSIGCNSHSRWTTAEIEFLEQLTDCLAVSIENVQLYSEVLQAKQEWEDTFKAVNDMIIVFDGDIQIVQFNDAAKRLIELSGNTNNPKLEKTFLDLIKETFQSQKTGYMELHYPNQTIYEVYTYPIQNNKQYVYGVIAYIKDVTEKRKMEVQLLHSGKLAAIGEMAAGIAHELNSPLTAILGNSQLLLRSFSKDDPAFSLLHDIKNCGDRCKQIIKSLLTFSRQDEYIFDTFSLNEAIVQVLNLLKFQFKNNQISLNLMLQNDLPLIEGSQTQIEQIIINLLLNAKDAVELSSSTEKEITIKTFKHCNEIHLSVTDNGIGIEENRRSEIFHPFYSTKKNGTGLGLSVSLGIAKTHGGTIEVISKPNAGSTFILKLRLQPSKELGVKS